MRGRRLERTVKLILLIIAFLFFGWALFSGAFDFIIQHPEDLIYLIKQHLNLVAVSSLLAVLVSVPLGILVTRPKFKKFEWYVMNFANIGQTVPSLAVLALVMSFFGLGYRSAVFALWVYSILPILRNTAAGIDSVSPDIIDAGKGMGMTSWEILWKLEIPNALYAILAGTRTAIVINVGTASLSFLIGGGGLGDLIFTGIAMHDTGIMLSGAIPVTILAISIDFLLGRFEKRIIPKGLQREIDAT